jgi:para-aminobenzoate synthetase component 2
MTKILVLDNYDSFVYTLNGYLQQLGAETEVLRNDVVAETELPELLAGFDAVLLSPGPGTPAEAGLSIPVVKFALENDLPVFGVCLGHQAIGEAMGATVLLCPSAGVAFADARHFYQVAKRLGAEPGHVWGNQFEGLRLGP